MFDVGFTELFVIALVALIVLGPKRLPEVARTAGRWLGRLRRFVADVKQDFDRELQDAELADLRNLKQELEETRRTFEETSGKLMRQVSEVQEEVAAELPANAPADVSANPPAGGTAPDAPTPASGARRRGGARRGKAAGKRTHEPG